MKKVKNLMLNVAAKGSVAAGVAGSLLFGFTSPVLAQSWYPAWVDTITGHITSGGVVDWARQWVQWALTLLFIIVFIVAVIYSALAAIKFISSQGDASKLEESKAAVKAILMGFAAMIIALVGIFIIFWVFGASAQFSESINNINEPPV
jgi:TRAP-type mannitol/chloroaromatic compound transport system permease small subunit